MDETAFICSKGFNEIYGSEFEFKEQLKQQQLHLQFQQVGKGWVFWGWADTGQRFDLLIHSPTCFGNNNDNYPEREIIKDKIKRVLWEFASRSKKYFSRYLVQFWGVEVDEEEEQVYLTTSDQPFAVDELYKGLCWYRQSCMAHRYRVDLRLYSTKEFPLRHSAARCGLTTYSALPVFDLLTPNCYDVIEVSSFVLELELLLSPLERGLKDAVLRTTHLNFCLPDPTRVAVHSEITRMADLAATVMPQLQMAHVWIPCHQCSNNSICFQPAFYSFFNFNFHQRTYLKACALHKLQIAGDINPIAQTLTSSNHKPCICRNICDFSISDNPLAHYAQNARLSFCFEICVQNLSNSREIYLVHFFLQFNSGDNALVGSFLQKVLSIMDRELKSFDFPYKGHNGEELIVEVVKENMVSYETFKYKYEDVSMLMVMAWFADEYYSLSEFMKYLQKPDLYYIKPSANRQYPWVFWSEANSSLSPVSVDTIQEKIKCLMTEITSSGIAQFWAAKKDDMDRFYLETAGQPFAVSSLSKGLASFRKQCVEHKYHVNDAANGPLDVSS